MERIVLTLMFLGLACGVFAAGRGSEMTKSPAGVVDCGGYRPHYQGFGVNSKGGRGGQVIRVTNLNDNGPGSLRAALEAEGPRFVIFDISGTIALESPLRILHPYITIAGQTAPSPGITTRNWSLQIATHDVVVQHLRVHMGDTQCEVGTEPVIRIQQFDGGDDPRNVVLDHISVAWAMDMGLRSSPKSSHISLLDCMFAFPLSRGFHFIGSGTYEFSGWGTGMGHIGATIENNQYTYARNLYVHNSYRSPIVGVGRVQVVNNVVYGAGPWKDGGENDIDWCYMQYSQVQYNPGIDSNPAYSSQGALINNYMIDSEGTGIFDQGPDVAHRTKGSTPGEPSFNFRFAENNRNQNTKIWLDGNMGPGITGLHGQGQYDGVQWTYSNLSDGEDIWYTSEPTWVQDFNRLPADQACTYVCANAGARPLDRDVVEAAAASQTRAALINDLPNMGHRIMSQDDMGGHPLGWMYTRRLQIPEKPNAIAPGQKFRTNIEMWLEKLARDLEPAQGGKAELIKETKALATLPAPTKAAVKAEPSVVLQPATTSPTTRETMKVSFSGVSNPTAHDWIGLFAPGAENEKCLAWRYTSSGTVLPGKIARSQGSCEFTMPPYPGTFEFRFFHNDQYTSLAVSESVTTHKKDFNITLTMSQDIAAPEKPVTVKYGNVPDLEGAEWVGLFQTDADDMHYKGWQWTNGKAEGSCTFTMPEEPGSYEFRLFAGGEKIATSEPVTVSVSQESN